MVWVRIDDRYSEHPKIVEAGPLCTALWLAGLAYCNRNLTDGFIPWSTARTLVDWEYAEQDGRRITIDIGCGMGGESVTSDIVISRMVSVGLWHPVYGETTKRIKGYLVHDYGDFQPSKAQVLHERELTAKRVQSFKERHKESNALGNVVSNGGANAKVTGDPVPGPVPVPKRKEKEILLSNPDGFDSFWSCYPRKESKQDAKKAWNQIAPQNGLVETILASIEQHKPHWTDPQYIPLPASYLRGRRWEDILITPTEITRPIDPKTHWKSREEYEAQKKRSGIAPRYRVDEWEQTTIH